MRTPKAYNKWQIEKKKKVHRWPEKASFFSGNENKGFSIYILSSRYQPLLSNNNQYWSNINVKKIAF